jgi:hypothetical protein
MNLNCDSPIIELSRLLIENVEKNKPTQRVSCEVQLTQRSNKTHVVLNCVRLDRARNVGLEDSSYSLSAVCFHREIVREDGYEQTRFFPKIRRFSLLMSTDTHRNHLFRIHRSKLSVSVQFSKGFHHPGLVRPTRPGTPWSGRHMHLANEFPLHL